MDAAYLKENVGEAISEGLAQVLVRQPQDSVEFLANWLLDYVNKQESEAKEKSRVQVLIAKDEAKQMEEAKKKAIEEADEFASTQDSMSRAERFVQYLTNARSLDGLFERFVTLMKEATSATTVSAAELRNDEYEASGAESSQNARDYAADYLKYVAVSDSESKILKERLSSGEGVTLDLFVPSEDDEPQIPEPIYDDDGNELPPLPLPEKPLKTLFVSNVLAGPMSEQIKFFNLPDTGSYLAVRVEYDSCLHDLVFDEADEVQRQLNEEFEQLEREREEREAEQKEQEAYEREREDAMLTEEERIERDLREEQERAEKLAEEEAKIPETEDEIAAREAKVAEEKRKKDEQALFDRLTKHRKRYAICLDTLGQNRRFTAEEINVITNISKVLQETLQKLDRELFFTERKTRAMIQEVTQSVPEKSEDERREEIERAVEEAQKVNQELSFADASFENRHTHIMELRQQILELRSYNVLRGPISILQALMYLLGFKQEQFADSDNRPEWRLMKELIDDNLVSRLEIFNPREVLKEKVAELESTAQEARDAAVAAGKKARPLPILKQFEDENSNSSTKNIERLLSQVDLDDLRNRNYILYELAGFITDSISLLHQAFQEYREEKKEERRRQREEEAQRRAEEEEAAAAAAAAAEEQGMPAVDEGEEEEEDE